MGADGYVLVLSETASSKVQSQGTLIIKNLLCSVTLYYSISILYAPLGDELLGGGPNSPSALLQHVGVRGHMGVCGFIFMALKSRRLVGCTY